MTGKQKTMMAAICMVLLIGAAGCAGKNLAPAHPNQISVFDGAAYDTLTIAQASLTQAKTLAPQYPQFKEQLNQAIASYNAALAAYKLYHSAGGGDASALNQKLANLTGQIAAVLSSLGVKLQ